MGLRHLNKTASLVKTLKQRDQRVNRIAKPCVDEIPIMAPVRVSATEGADGSGVYRYTVNFLSGNTLSDISNFTMTGVRALDNDTELSVDDKAMLVMIEPGKPILLTATGAAGGVAGDWIPILPVFCGLTSDI